MSQTKFDNFLRRESEKARLEKPFDRDAEISRWLARLERLHDQIRSLLSTYIADGRIVVTTADVAAYEEALGSYVSKSMTLQVGATAIRFEPVGAFIFGAFGRVDMIGPKKDRMLLLSEANANSRSFKIRILSADETPPSPNEPVESELEWKFVGEPPQRVFSELSQETLMDAILEVSGD